VKSFYIRTDFVGVYFSEISSMAHFDSHITLSTEIILLAEFSVAVDVPEQYLRLACQNFLEAN